MLSFPSCRSAQDTLDWIYHDPVLFALTFVDHFAAAWGRVMYKTWTCFTWGNFRTQGKQAYNEHYARVRNLVSTDNLLEYHVSQGWKPLCEFLEVDIPTVPFPSGNEPTSFRAQMRAFEKSRAMAVLAKSTVGVEDSSCQIRASSVRVARPLHHLLSILSFPLALCVAR